MSERNRESVTRVRNTCKFAWKIANLLVLYGAVCHSIFFGSVHTMSTAKVANSLNKTLHLTGIGIAVQAFYINLTLDSVLGGEYLELAPAGPPIINPASVWDVNGVPVHYGPNNRDTGTAAEQTATSGVVGGRNQDANVYRDQKGNYVGGAGLKISPNIGQIYGGVRDHGVIGVQGSNYGDIQGRNKGHNVAGYATSLLKNENGNKATQYDDGLGRGSGVLYGLQDQRFKDGFGNAYGGTIHDSSVRSNAVGNQGQFGNAVGYRGSNNRGLTLTGADLHREGLVRGALPLGPLVAPPQAPVYIPKPMPFGNRPMPALIPVPGVDSRSEQAAASNSILSIPKSSTPYIIPTPTKLYVDKPTL